MNRQKTLPVLALLCASAIACGVIPAATATPTLGTPAATRAPAKTPLPTGTATATYTPTPDPTILNVDNLALLSVKSDLRGQQGSFDGIAFMPDSQRLIAVSSGISATSNDSVMQIILWDVQTGERIWTTEQTQFMGRYDSMALAPDGSRLALGLDDRITIVDPETGDLLDTIRNLPDGLPVAMAFSPDSATLAVGFSTGEIVLFRAEDRFILHHLNGHDDYVVDLAFSHDGRLLASAAQDFTARIWDVETGDRLHTLRHSTSNVDAVAFSADDALLYVGDWSNGLGIWDVETGSLQDTLSDFDAYSGAETLAVSPDGGLLVGGTFNSPLLFWETEGYQLTRLMGDQDTSYLHVVFSPDGKLVAAAPYDGDITVWGVEPEAVARGELLPTATPTITPSPTPIAGALARFYYPDGPAVAAFSPDGRYLSISEGSGFHQIDTATYQTVWSLPIDDKQGGIESPVLQIAYRPDGLLAVASAYGTLLLLDPQTGAILDSLSAGEFPTAIAFSPDNTLMAIASAGNGVTVYDTVAHEDVSSTLLESGRPGAPDWQPDTDWATDVSFDSSGRYLAAASYNGVIDLYDLQAWRHVRTLEDMFADFAPGGWLVSYGGDAGTIHQVNILTGQSRPEIDSDAYSLAISLDGSLLANDTWDYNLYLWDAATGQELVEMTSYDVESFALSPDDRLLAVGHSDGSISFYDIAEGRWQMYGLKGHEYAVTQLAFSPDSALLMSLSWDDNGVVLWPVSP